MCSRVERKAKEHPQLKDVVFDLDGTLALCGHRRHHVEGKKKDWDAFFDECDKDTVNEPIANLFRHYRSLPDYRVWILSGRSGVEATHKKTVDWLVANDLEPDVVSLTDYDTPMAVQHCFMMRQPNDRRHDVKIKLEMAEQAKLNPKTTECIFDDRNCMVDAWRKAGFTCLQVAEGDF